MSDYLDKLAELSDQIVDVLDVDADADPDEAFEKAEAIQAQLDELIENPPPPPEIEQPKEAPPQVEPAEWGNSDTWSDNIDEILDDQPDPLVDPLADVRGLTAEEIDKAMKKTPMLDMIEAATGTRPAQRTKAAELAEQLFKLAA